MDTDMLNEIAEEEEEDEDEDDDDEYGDVSSGCSVILLGIIILGLIQLIFD